MPPAIPTPDDAVPGSRWKRLPVALLTVAVLGSPLVALTASPALADGTASDDWSDAPTASIPSSFSVDNSDQSFTEEPGDEYRADVWFKISPTVSQTLTIHSVPTNGYTADSLEIWSLTDGDRTYIDSAIDPDETSGALLTVPVTAGQDYLVGYGAFDPMGIETGPATVTIGIPTPDAPSNVVPSPEDGAVGLSWDAPSDNGSAITSYTVHAYTGSSGTTEASGYPQTVTGTPPATTFDATGLTNGTAYRFAVVATNGNGDSEASAEESATPVAAATAPDAPTNLVATPGDTTVDLSWDAPNDNGSALTDYTVHAYVGSSGTTEASGFPQDISGTPPTNSYTATGLTNGTAYRFAVVATNGVGDSSSSSEQSATPVAAATAPDAPTGVSATGGNGSLAVSWTAPVNNGGSTITGYSVSASASGHPTVSGTSTGTSKTLTGLVNGVSYTVTVAAVNGIGTGSTGSTTGTPATVADQPGLTITRSWYSLKATVAAPGFNGGSAITQYVVTLTSAHSTQTRTVSAPGDVTFSGLTPSTAYTVAAHAVNGKGSSANRSVSTSTTALPAPIAISGTNQLTAGESVALTGDGLFPANSYQLTAAGHRQLVTLAAKLNTAAVLRCDGYTDIGKDANWSYWLGLARAQTVCNTLKSLGVHASTSIVSYGQTKPVTLGNNRSLNRRVIVFVAATAV